MVNIDRIKELAKEKGIKIKYICSQLGLAETYLSNVKNGKDRMTDERLQKIADILDTTVEYLTGESDEKESSVGITVSLTSEESALIESYRNSPENVRKAVKALLDFGG